MLVVGVGLAAFGMGRALRVTSVSPPAEPSPPVQGPAARTVAPFVVPPRTDCAAQVAFFERRLAQQKRAVEGVPVPFDDTLPEAVRPEAVQAALDELECEAELECSEYPCLATGDDGCLSRAGFRASAVWGAMRQTVVDQTGARRHQVVWVWDSEDRRLPSTVSGGPEERNLYLRGLHRVMAHRRAWMEEKNFRFQNEEERAEDMRGLLDRRGR